MANSSGPQTNLYALLPFSARSTVDGLPHRSRWRTTLQRFIGFVTSACFAVAASAQVCSIPGRDGTGPTAGIVNTYYAPVIPSGAVLTVGGGTASIGLTGATGAAAALVPGDMVLVIQMQCATIDATNSAAYGGGGTSGRGYTDPIANCLAGRYEYVKAGPGTTGSTLDLTGSTLANTYTQDADSAANRRSFQLIRVPQYSSLTLSGNMQAAYWNGATGGVVALDVAGQLDWGGRSIDVAGRGFRGGGAVDQGFTADGDTVPDYVATLASDQHASKGEGIAGTPRRVWNQATNATQDNGAAWGGYVAGDTGRGAPGNAGGGGNNRSGSRDNGGGGGGGNGSVGGFGGLGWRSGGWNDAAATAAGYPNVAADNATVFNLRGIGGAAFASAAANRLAMGGGGGAGGENSNSTGTTASGGAGGGIVMVRAGAITGAGGISAQGAGGQSQTGNDAAGGGGAGGSVLVWSNSAGGSIGTLIIDASGGRGGDSFVGGATAHGGGGGGAGGVVQVTAPLPPATSTVTVNVSGGANGVTNTVDLPAGSSAAHGATPGAAGAAATIATDPPGAGSGPRCLPALTVAKSTSTPTRSAGVDLTATYSVVISNGVAGGTVTGVNLVDDLPSPLTYVGAANVVAAYSGGASGPASPLSGAGADPVIIGVPGGGVSDSFTLPPGASVTLTFPVNLNAAPIGTYQNPAAVNYTDPTRAATGQQTVTPGAGYATGGGVAGGNNYIAASSTAEDVVVQGAVLTITKVANVASAASGASFTFTVQASNTGTVASGNPTTVVDTIPTGVRVTALASGAGFICTPSSDLPLVGDGSTSRVSCVSATGVAAGQASATVVILTVTKTGTNSVTNTASATTGDPGCPAAARCTGTTTVPDASQPTLTVTKSASIPRGLTGTAFTYTVTISNTGSAASGNTVVTDAVPAGVTINSISAGFGWVCSPASVVGPSTFSCTKASGVATGVSNELVATLNATKTAIGTVVNTVNVTSGDPGCSATPAPARCTSSAAVAGIPDMFPTFTPNFTTYNLNESRDVIININEINGVDSSGIIQFFVPNSAGFTYTYDLTRTSATILGDPYTVQNTDWTIQTLPTGKRFTSRPGVVIPAGGQSRIVMTCTADVAGTLASITVNITAGSGTEVRTNNNSVVLGQSVQE